MNDNILEVEEVRKVFSVEKSLLGRTTRTVTAVDGVSLSLRRGRTLGVVGESGSGKSTLGRLALQLEVPTSGRIRFDGEEVVPGNAASVRSLRQQMQVVFQDPYSSFDPMATVGSSVAEPLRTHRLVPRSEQPKRVAELLRMVGLQPSHGQRYPQELSGGQLQRIAIARALACDPRLLVLDEPVSALDVSTQADVINLLMDLQREQQVAYLFIAHDLAVVRHVSDDIAVMYLGQIVEQGPAEEVYTNPRHPYTQALLSAIPVADPEVQRSRERIKLSGEIPSPANPPNGCRFHTRCAHAMEVCRTIEPERFDAPGNVTVNCHLHTTGPRLEGRSLIDLPMPTLSASA